MATFDETGSVVDDETIVNGGTKTEENTTEGKSQKEEKSGFRFKRGTPETADGIPSREELPEEHQAVVDEILATVDVRNSATAQQFGDALLEQISSDMEEINQLMTEHNIGANASAIRNLGESLSGLNTAELQETAFDLLDTGAGVVDKAKKVAKKNKKELMLTGAGAVAAGLALPFVSAAAPLVAGGGYIAFKQWRGQDKREAEIEKVSAALTEAIKDIPGMTEELKAQQKKLPAYMDASNKLYDKTKDKIYGALLHIIAGRIAMEEAQAALNDVEEDDLLSEEKKEIESFNRVMNMRLTILEQVYNASMKGVLQLENHKDTLQDTSITIQSILTAEVALTQSEIVQASVALANQRLASVVTEFRDTMRTIRGTSSTLAVEASKSARDARPDSAKLINQYKEETMKTIELFQKNLEEKQRFAIESQKARGQLLLETQTMRKAFETGALALEGQGASNAALEDHSNDNSTIGTQNVDAEEKVAATQSAPKRAGATLGGPG